MGDKKSVVEKKDLSRFGKKDLNAGDRVTLCVDLVGLGKNATVKVTEKRYGGAQFRVEKIMVGDEKPARDWLVWANQIAG